MSAPADYRAPAWRGLHADTPVYDRVDARLASDVTQALGIRGSLQRLANAGDASSLFLRLDVDGAPSQFLKVLSAPRGQALSQAEDVAQWLHAAAMPVVASERTCSLPDGRQVWVYPFHSGRPPQADLTDMAMVGSALGKLHGALQRHPLSDHWRRQTDARMLRLMKVRAAVAQGSLRAGPDAQGFQQIANDASIALHPDMFVELGPRTPIHGDLNRFNMLVNDTGCIFLDFEDVQHSVFPAMVDLATVIERVVLVRPDAQGHAQHIHTLLEAYQTQRPDVDLNKGLQALPAIQRSLALRSLCTLAETDPSGQHAEEWAKFFHLMALAEGTMALDANRKGTGTS